MWKAKNTEFDIVIIGGGHAGLTTAILLAQSDFKVACIDPENPKEWKKLKNNRTTAISYGSAKILNKTGAWQGLLKKACPIEDIKILDGSHSRVFVEFLSHKIEREAFGWIVDNIDLKTALFEKLKKQKTAQIFSTNHVIDFKDNGEHYTIDLKNGKTIKARMIIGADGRQSFTRKKLNIPVRQWSYDQTAIVSIITHEKPHQNIAIEHFFKEGPFAILPMSSDAKGNHRSSIVWTEENMTPRSILNYDEETFLLALKTRFPDFYGDLISAGPRLSYPLNFIHASRYTDKRAALVADAAHGIHPIAGQGLNIGLRDIDVLCGLMISAKEQGKDWASDNLLQEYEQTRRKDNASMAGATDNLNALFGTGSKSLKIARKIGLNAVEKFKPAKEFFMRRAMGE